VASERSSDVHAVAALAVETATRYVGTPYRWGGSTPAGFDCSGFVQFVFREQGIELPRVSRDQARVGEARPASLDDLAPGDLLFFAQGSPTVDHVAIYAGDGRIVHASRSGYGVRYDELTGPRGRYYAQHLVAVRRVIEGGAATRDTRMVDASRALPVTEAFEALEAEQNDGAPAPESGD
jgi:cell wall-associated NlpC family hydrolase